MVSLNGSTLSGKKFIAKKVMKMLDIDQQQRQCFCPPSLLFYVGLPVYVYPKAAKLKAS